MAFQDDVAGQVRAELARRQVSGRRVALALGWSQYYVAARLRGEVPFSLADLQAMSEFLEVPMTAFFEVPAYEVRRPGSCPPDLAAAA